MGNKGGANVESPQVPSFFSDPNLKGNADFLSFIGQSLGQGGAQEGFSPNLPNRLTKRFGDGTLDFLFENTSLNPEITAESIGLATRDVVRLRDEAQKAVQNQLEANNQTQSSVANTSLNELNREFSADIADIATNFRVADQQRALQSRLDLFGLGLNSSAQAGQLGATNQSQRNSFNLENYNNQLAAAYLQSQDQGRGGFGGALTGGLGGAITGFALGGPVGAGIGALGGGLAGGFGPAGTGAQIFGGGGTAAGLAASGFFTPTSGTSNSLSKFTNTTPETDFFNNNRTARSAFSFGGF